MAGILPSDPRPWPERRDAGLGNATMRTTIGVVTRRFSSGQRRVFHEYAEAEQARQVAVQAKRRAVRHMDQLIPKVRAKIESHGGQTYMAQDAREAVRLLVEIAQAHDVQTAIKTKSMLSEEIALNRGLEKAGITVVETDLGEYIIQRAHESPSHILAPAAHKNRTQIKHLLDDDARSVEMETPHSEEPADLTRFARSRLRREFLSADMGITGGNFLVAETGTLVLITNEGNADMVTSLPPVLVSIVGVEKVVETWDDLTYLIQQPAMNGIGQRLSSYTTLISGPRQPGMAEGAAEWHVVLVDNGRSSLQGTPFEDVLSCIRCGACLNVCPVFRQVGGHAYGGVYAGPIGIVETPLLTDLQVLPELPSVACTVCHACGEACPMDIDLPGHVLRLRKAKVARCIDHRSARWSYRLWSQVWSTSARYRRSLRLARIAQKLYLKNGQLKNAPGLAQGWFQSRDMPPIAPEMFHEWWQRTRGNAHGQQK